MSFPRYLEYKDSGVEWLGQIPKDWDVKRLKFLGEAIIGLTYDPSEVVDEYDGTLVLRSSNVQNGQIVFADNVFVKKSIPDKLITKYGDILICSRTGSRALIGKNAVIKNDAQGLSFGAFMTIFRSEYNEYLSYIFNSSLFEFQSGSFLTSTVNQWTVGNLYSFEVPLPPTNERKIIAAFLDRETAKIDALIAEPQRLIELLKEKRQAVMSHAVTKGLNPNTPMKDSGIEWLGEVPAHWCFGAIKHFVLQKPGAIKTGPFGSHLTSSDMQSGNIKVYNQRNVIDDDFVGGENFITEDKFRQLANFEAFPGDLLITTRGTIGRAAILPKNAERGILHPCLLRIQSDESQVKTEFLKSLIQDSDLMKTQINYMSNATTIEVIYSVTIASVVIPVPPIPEQELILDFLKSETTKLDTLNTEAQRAIALLKERRSALISAAVTGKIDVRGLVSTQPNQEAAA